MDMLGKRAVISILTEQKINFQNFPKAKLDDTDNKLSKRIHTKKFIENRYFKMELDIMYQDNASSMKLQKSSKKFM